MLTSDAHIFISQITDPWINLAIEDHLFKQYAKDRPILFLWQCDRAVVIGRAQNPWLECNLQALNNDGIPVVRRQSGGGTVYHDLGNINFSFLMPNHLYDKKQHLSVITSALETIGLSSHINNRNDIVTRIDNIDYKLSGSAYRETKHASFHHGTLLIDSDLSAIEKYLHHPIDPRIKAKGVASVRSKVTAVNQAISQQVSIQTIYQSITEHFCHTYKLSNDKQTCLCEADIHHCQTINDYVNQTHNWQWLYGKCLPFEYTLDLSQFLGHGQVILQIKKATIENVTYHHIDTAMLPLLEAFFITNPTLTAQSLHHIVINELNQTEQLLYHKMAHLFI